ncbi:stress-responsive transcription factor hsf1 [Allomyces arbusculus]|nr:stress-responsive transcription factor hsf1 [Allomyces arbusculus]
MAGGNSTFISKLYAILQDKSIVHLICWTPNGDGFRVLSPTEFARQVLPACFKHNNISSFVRQLNMYGFSKVSDQSFALAALEATKHAASSVLASSSSSSSSPVTSPAVTAGALATETPAAGGDEQSDAAPAAAATVEEQKGRAVPYEQPWEFRHPYFQRDKVHLLPLIKRKTSKPAAPPAVPNPADLATIPSTAGRQGAEAAPEDVAAAAPAAAPTRRSSRSGLVDAAAIVERLTALEHRVVDMQAERERARSVLARLASAVLLAAQDPNQRARVVDDARSVLMAISAEGPLPDSVASAMHSVMPPPATYSPPTTVVQTPVYTYAPPPPVPQQPPQPQPQQSAGPLPPISSYAPPTLPPIAQPPTPASVPSHLHHHQQPTYATYSTHAPPASDVPTYQPSATPQTHTYYHHHMAAAPMATAPQGCVDVNCSCQAGAPTAYSVSSVAPVAPPPSKRARHE